MVIFVGLVCLSGFIAIMGAVAGTVSYIGGIVDDEESEDDF